MLYLDLETYSEVPIEHGTHAYAENAAVILFAWALRDEPARVWEPDSEPMPEELRAALLDPKMPVVAHNSHFDRTVLRHTMPDVCPQLERWHDTMVMALEHSLPGSLAELGAALGLPKDQAKDKEAGKLVHVFCKPGRDGSVWRRARAARPEDWNLFRGYAVRDVEAMRAVHRRLPRINATKMERALWLLDQRINDRGFATDTELAEGALSACEAAKEAAQERLAEITQNRVGTFEQRAKLLEFLADECHVVLPDLSADTVRKAFNALTPEARTSIAGELLSTRMSVSKSSTAKYQSLLNGVSSDGRLRGTLQFCGASRTGRWAGRLFQPQNLPRPTVKGKALEDGIAALKAGCADLITDDVMGLASSALRGCIVAGGGTRLVVSDLSNIEGRVLAWLAGEEWKVRAFKEFDRGVGSDLYVKAYAKTFGKPEGFVTDDERQVGKVLELSMGYGGAVGAFIAFAPAYRIDLAGLAVTVAKSAPQGILQEAATALARNYERGQNTIAGGVIDDRVWVAIETVKRMWRNEHQATVRFWHSLAECAIRTMETGVATRLRNLLFRRDGSALVITLPSGRSLCYHSMKVEGSKLSYLGVDQTSRKWTRIETYYGKLAENVTQAVARDVLAEGMLAVENDGMRIVLTVHDEVIAEAPDTEDFPEWRMSRLLATAPKWAKGLPLAAKGNVCYRYTKG